MFTKILVCCLVHHVLILPVDGVSVFLNPQSMVTGSSTANPTSLNMQCSSSGTPDVDTLLQLKLSRRKFTEPAFIGIASMKFDGVAKLDTIVPSDIQTRSPNISGSVDTEKKSGTMTVSINAQGLTCTDQAEFQCFLTYLDSNQISQTVYDNKNFTVITVPSEVVIDSPEYYDVNGNTLQLTNNSVLNAGTRIKYKCTANVGSVPEGEIIWERSSEMGSMDTFIPYTPTNDIVQEASRQDGCFYRRTSTMYYNLTKLDEDGISFRCRARTYLGGQLYEALANQQFRSVTAPSGGTTGPTTQPGSSDNNSTVLAAVLGVVVGASVILIVILSLFLHRSHKLTKELQSQLQSRSHTYDGLMGTVATSEPYAILNLEPTENHLQSNYLNPYDRLNRKVGNSEPYDMLESHHSDANVHH